MSDHLIRGGRVTDPSQGIDEIMDVMVRDGRIECIAKDIKDIKEVKEIDARGLIVCPGLIDMHVHLREPGREDEETIASGTEAAARGGFTSIACMANTKPVVDTATVVKMIKEKARDVGWVNVWPVGAMTKGLEGKELVEMGDMLKSGACAFSDDGRGVMDAEVMRRVLEYAKMFDIPMIVHAEDRNLSKKGQMNEGYYSTLLGLRPIPAEAEETMVARDILLARLTGARVHFTHVSTGGSVELIRRAKKACSNLTCDVTPHHLVLTDADLIDYNTDLKVNPPLRSKDDVKALIMGLKDGTIDAIASDHAPHAPQEKECEFEYAAFGMIGLETTVSLMLTHIVGKNILSIGRLIEKMSVNPAHILKMDTHGSGSLKEGSSADITFIDTKAEVKVDRTKMASLSRNTPFNGWRLTGKAVLTMVNGNIVSGDALEKEAVKA